MMPGIVILLDIDGVVNRLASAREGYVARRLTVDVATVRRVQRLAGLGEIVWVSEWDADTRASLAATVGLPAGTRAITHFPPADGPRAATEKLPGVARWLDVHEPDGGWVRVVWVDDVLYEDAARWADDRPYPALVVRTDPVRGLTDAEVDRVEAFVTLPG